MLGWIVYSVGEQPLAGREKCAKGIIIMLQVHFEILENVRQPTDIKVTFFLPILI